MNDIKLKIGFIGLGNRGPSHVFESLRFDDVEIAALCDIYEDRVFPLAKEIEQRTGVKPFATTNYKDIIYNFGNKTKEDNKYLDAVIISTSWETHIPIAVDFLRAGIVTAMEVSGASSEEECRTLIETCEQTKTRFFFMENCCYDRREMMLFNMVKDGFFGEISHCDGSYAHDLRREISFGEKNRHYRLRHYINYNSENYPTHELGPIARILNINKGNRMKYLTSMSSKSVGLHEFIMKKAADDEKLVNTKFAQGDIVTTNIMCENGATITLRLDTTLPRAYSRGLVIHGTKAMYSEEGNFLFDDSYDVELYSSDSLRDNFKKYEDRYLADEWKAEITGGHGGMDYLMLRDFYKRLKTGEEFSIDVYDAATWMCISYLSAKSIALGSAPVEIPDFTNGRWKDAK